MAQGRMLKKVICTSKKLANLRTDSARLLYTWLLPHLDIEGRFSGDISVIKGHIFPRLKHMTIKKIERDLRDLVKSGLIIVYKAKGDIFLELIDFHKHQYLNPKREAESDIPSPPPLQKIKRRCLTKKEYEYAWEKWRENGMICPICKKKGEFVANKGIVIDEYIPFQIDHKIPISKGGTYDLSNLRVVCQKCNAQKGNMLTLELIQSTP
ncbi:unnamed protein product, partial [marine sediment metagenome]